MVWGFIISLRREDAERVGYNSAEQWVNLLRSRRNVIAKEMGIAPSSLRWVAAYHNKETNPHVHMMVWSSRPQEPYLSREGIHNIKKTFASDIFRQEHLQIYKKQTEARDDIKTSCRIIISALTSMTLLPALLLIFEKLMDKTAKRELVLKDKKLCSFAVKGSKAVVPIALALIIACGVLQFGNAYSFTDSKGSNTAIEDVFGSNNSVVVVYPNSNGSFDKESELADKLLTFKTADGKTVLKNYTAYSNNQR